MTVEEWNSSNPDLTSMMIDVLRQASDRQLRLLAASFIPDDWNEFTALCEDASENENAMVQLQSLRQQRMPNMRDRIDLGGGLF